MSGGRLLHPQPEDVPCPGDYGPTLHGLFNNYKTKINKREYSIQKCMSQQIQRFSNISNFPYKNLSFSLHLHITTQYLFSGSSGGAGSGGARK
jgi:hypothetical protein